MARTKWLHLSPDKRQGLSIRPLAPDAPGGPLLASHLDQDCGYSHSFKWPLWIRVHDRRIIDGVGKGVREDGSVPCRKDKPLGENVAEDPTLYGFWSCGSVVRLWDGIREVG